MSLSPALQPEDGVSPGHRALEAEVRALKSRIERERRARLEAEAIGERGLRELFKRQEELLIVEAIAEAANTSPTLEETMRFALEKFSGFAGWPLGHLCMASNPDGAAELISTEVWHLVGRDRYEPLRRATTARRFAAGQCLPGRVAGLGEPVWFSNLQDNHAFLRADAAAACGLRFAFGFPIRVGSEVAAVLEFFAEEAPTPNEELLRLATHIGTQLGRVIERKRAADRLIDAYQDPLTGLPNRALLLEDLQLAIRRRAHDQKYRFAVLFLDLDRFKVVNDSLGHVAGDRLLVETARRIKACVRRPERQSQHPGFPEQRPDTVARLGGDEFVVLLSDIHDNSDAIRAAERIERALATPFDLGTQQVTTSASIGIALSVTGYDDPQVVLRDADSAMYRAKASGTMRYAVFDPAMHESAMARLQLESELRLAVERNELTLHYQPLIALADNRIIGFEALVRWRHPQRGTIGPADFVPLAEETGLIQPIGRWTLQAACRQMREWLDRFGDEELMVAVNVSAKQFAHPDLVLFIAEVLATTSLPASHLSLELTESVAMDRVDQSAQTLEQLKALGIRIAIDDFGTGFSSLAYLHQLPVDVLKVDSKFVSRLEGDAAGVEIVRAILALAAALDLAVVAEGIETAHQFALLRALGCKYGQGYFIAPPQDARAMTAFAEISLRSRRG